MGWFKFELKLPIRKPNVVPFSVFTQLNQNYLQTIQVKFNFQFGIQNKIKFYSAGLGLSPALCQSDYCIILKYWCIELNILMVGYFD